MKRIVLTFLTAAALGLAIPAIAPRVFAGEEKLKEADVPKAGVGAGPGPGQLPTSDAVPTNRTREPSPSLRASAA